MGFGCINSQGVAGVMTLKGFAVLLRRRANAELIQNIKRGSVSLCEFAQTTSPNHQTALIIKLSRNRSQISIRADGITAGVIRGGHGVVRKGR
jgi:hypothetical protein